MLVSHEHKFVFYHVPRTGGSTITHALRDYVDLPIDNGILANNPKRYTSDYDLSPDALAEWQSQYHINLLMHSHFYKIKRYEDYFKFAFVRNPWERTFSEFCGHVKGRPDEWTGITSANLYKFLTTFLYLQENYFPQSWYFGSKDSGVYVARFENWDAEFKYIVYDVLGLKKVKYTLLNRSKSSSLNYRQYFTKASIELVREFHKDDIKRFGYEY